jgi:Tfp pilus assembly protein PilN
MIEINLIPDVKQELISAQRTRAFVVTTSILTGIAALAIVALLAVYVFVVQQVRDDIANNSIETSSAALAEKEDLSKILTIQNQLAQIEALSETKKIDSRIFDVLASVLPPEPNEVQVSSLALDAETSTMVIEGQTPTFDTLEVFKKTIDGAVLTYPLDDEEVIEKLAESITVSDVSYGENTNGQRVLQFTISFVFPPSLFAANVPNYEIRLTNAGDVTDSFLGIPRSIFVGEEEG